MKKIHDCYDCRLGLPHYTVELNLSIDAMISSFSSLKRPDPEKFTLHDRYNDHGGIRKPSDVVVNAFKALGVDKFHVSASTVFDARVVMLYAENDVKLWLIPIVASAIRDWWSIKLLEEQVNKDIMANQPYAYAEWLRKSLFDMRRLMSPVASLFCDTYWNQHSDEPKEDGEKYKYSVRVRLQEAEFYKRLMTSDMRKSVKQFLILWYDVFGQRTKFPPMTLRLGRQWAHNFCFR